ncbi:hypothetical protein FKM82_029354 [Ascaphus truei]
MLTLFKYPLLPELDPSTCTRCLQNSNYRLCTGVGWVCGCVSNLNFLLHLLESKTLKDRRERAFEGLTKVDGFIEEPGLHQESNNVLSSVTPCVEEDGFKCHRKTSVKSKK